MTRKKKKPARQQQANTKTQPEPKPDTKAASDKLASICGQVGAGLGVFAAVFGTMDYHGAMIVLSILAIVAIGLAVVLHLSNKFKWYYFSAAVIIAIAISLWLILAKIADDKSKDLARVASSPTPTVTATPVPQSSTLIAEKPSPTAAIPLNTQFKLTETRTTEANGNYLSDLRIIQERDRSVDMEVWYFYNGVLGKEDVLITVRPLDHKGAPMQNGGTISGGQIAIINTKAISKLRYDYVPTTKSISEQSTQIELCMYHLQKEEFYCRRFPYKKIWK